MRHYVAPLVALTLTATQPAMADEAGAVAAALKDEKSECRYLLQLCGKAKESLADATKRYERELACAKQPPIGRNADVEALKQSPCYGIALEPNGDARMRVAAKQLEDVSSVVTVLKAKHDKPPKCIEECGVGNR
jgi:hypothetical protein